MRGVEPTVSLTSLLASLSWKDSAKVLAVHVLRGLRSGSAIAAAGYQGMVEILRT